METENLQIISSYDGLALDTILIEPSQVPKGIVQICHGMAEHKERYIPFMEYLANCGYISVIHDLRGHGASVKSSKDLGYFYTDDINALVGDLHDVNVYVKTRYPGLGVSLFSHSMGTLIARVYLKKYDGEVEKLVLCGPPTENSLVDFGLTVNTITGKLLSDKKPNKLVNLLAFSGAATKFHGKFNWLSVSKNNVKEYENDPLCGFVFTSNGFHNLFQLQKQAFVADDWNCTNPDLPILVIAGEDDPIIQSKKHFNGLLTFLYYVGYRNIQHKLYVGLRHEILNEECKDDIYFDVIEFLNH